MGEGYRKVWARLRVRGIQSSLRRMLRYVSGAVALAITLAVLRPLGELRQVLILYAHLPGAMINALLAQRAERDAEAVALQRVVAAAPSGWNCRAASAM